jgi:hypothetical protein
MENLLLAVVMPALNEEENIRAAIDNALRGMVSGPGRAHCRQRWEYGQNRDTGQRSHEFGS